MQHPSATLPHWREDAACVNIASHCKTILEDSPSRHRHPDWRVAEKAPRGLCGRDETHHPLFSQMKFMLYLQTFPFASRIPLPQAALSNEIPSFFQAFPVTSRIPFPKSGRTGAFRNDFQRQACPKECQKDAFRAYRGPRTGGSWCKLVLLTSAR